MTARHAGVVVVTSAALCSAGCVASRPTPPLDAAETAELTAIRDRLGERGVRVVAPMESNWTWCGDVLAALDEVDLAAYRRVAEPRPGDVVLDVDRTSERFTEWNAALSALTLLLVPTIDEGRTIYRLRWSAAGGDATAECSTETPRLAGWVAPLVALRRGWRFGDSSADDDGPERTAMLARLGLDIARSVDDFTRAK